MSKSFDNKKIFANINWILGDDIENNPIELPNNISVEVTPNNNGYSWIGDFEELLVYNYKFNNGYALTLSTYLFRFIIDENGSVIIVDQSNPKFTPKEIRSIYNSCSSNRNNIKLNLPHGLSVLDNKIEINILVGYQINKKIIKYLNQSFG